MDPILYCLTFWSPLLHHLSTTSSHNFPFSLLEKSEQSWALISDAELQKKQIIIRTCDYKEVKSAMRIKKASKQDGTKQKTGKKERIWQAKELKQRYAANLLNYKKDSSLQERFWKQLLLKAASSEDAERVYVPSQPLLASTKNKGSIFRTQYAIRPAPDNDIEFFSKKLKRKEAKFPSQQEERKAMNINKNRGKNESKHILAHRLQILRTHEANYHDGSVKMMPCDVRQGALIMLIPHTEMETETEPSKAANTERRWEIIKELADPAPFIKSLKDFISETEKRKCKYFEVKKSFLKLYLIDRREMTDLKIAEKIPEVTTVAAPPQTTKETQDNVAGNSTEEPKTEEESVIPSAPSLGEMQTETTTAGYMTEETTVKMEIQETTEVLGQSSTTDVQPSGDQRQTTPPDSDLEPRFIKCVTHNTQATPKVQFSGLRMRDELSVITGKLNQDEEKDEKGSANCAESGRKQGLDPDGRKSQTIFKSSEDVQKEHTDKDPKAADGTTQLCKGLIDRTEAGWKHCKERQAGPATRPASVWDIPDEKNMRRDNLKPPSNEDDHFYYFNGVLKRVQNNVQVYFKRHRRRRRRGTTEDAIRERE
ncbi:PREDICTED: uncharacterized protein LOC107092851 [Cyprinodon variegatus]|uniref:uncharacterized protein LOC107092851 n=1 Tax=Cyprinodon variegatus TaxID=28743 RepID=UPI000742807B|nr:PREDICTED: uncharacterized protein LOC107092851 [Cyprinodon variegatus]